MPTLARGVLALPTGTVDLLRGCRPGRLSVRLVYKLRPPRRGHDVDGTSDGSAGRRTSGKYRDSEKPGPPSPSPSATSLRSADVSTLCEETLTVRPVGRCVRMLAIGGGGEGPEGPSTPTISTGCASDGPLSLRSEPTVSPSYRLSRSARRSGGRGQGVGPDSPSERAARPSGAGAPTGRATRLSERTIRTHRHLHEPFRGPAHLLSAALRLSQRGPWTIGPTHPAGRCSRPGRDVGSRSARTGRWPATRRPSPTSPTLRPLA